MHPHINPGQQPQPQPIRENPPNPDPDVRHLSLIVEERPKPHDDTYAGVAQTYPPPARPDPRPAGIFSYLPEDYAKPTIPISRNAVADDTAATVKETFTTEVLRRRRAVDNHLKEFKMSLGKGINAPLPACFVSWKNGLFPKWPEQEPFLVEYCVSESDNTCMLKAIHARKHQQYLTPEQIATGQHMNNLLDACHNFRLHKEDMKKTIREQNLQLLRVELRSKTLNSIQSELQSLPAEIDRFGEEIDTLLKNILAALLPYGQTQKGREITGMKQIHKVIIAAK